LASRGGGGDARLDASDDCGCQGEAVVDEMGQYVCIRTESYVDIASRIAFRAPRVWIIPFPCELSPIFPSFHLSRKPCPTGARVSATFPTRYQTVSDMHCIGYCWVSFARKHASTHATHAAYLCIDPSIGRLEEDLADSCLYGRIPRHHRGFARHVCSLYREACTFMIRTGRERGPCSPTASECFQRSDLGRHARTNADQSLLVAPIRNESMMT
jgi:hypothetical protein